MSISTEVHVYSTPFGTLPVEEIPEQYRERMMGAVYKATSKRKRDFDMDMRFSASKAAKAASDEFLASLMERWMNGEAI